MGWLGRLFGSRSRITAAGVLAGYFRGWCIACATSLQPSDEKVREKLKSAMKGIDPEIYEEEVYVLVLLAAVESMYEKPWAEKLVSPFIKIVTMRMFYSRTDDTDNKIDVLRHLDNKICDLLQGMGSLTELDRYWSQTAWVDEGTFRSLSAVESRIRDYRAILAEGWHPASTRLGVYAVRSMGGSEQNMILAHFIWIDYATTYQLFAEVNSQFESEFDLDHLE